MSGVINRIGAESGILGTTEAAPGMSSDVIGGTKRTYSGYESRTFLGSGSIYFPEDKTVDWFLVGGGGGGGDGFTSNGNGGGGAGGVVQAVGYTISAGSYNISIGHGSEGGHDGAIPNTDAASGSARGQRGQPSVFGTFVAHGGGGGASTWMRQGQAPGAEGGCAGGGANAGAYYNNATQQTTYSGTPNVTGYGYTGGPVGADWGGGGGGGAGGAGTVGSNTQYGHGGVGRTCVYEDGTTKYFAGGGGGGGNSSEPGGAGQYGGGRGHGHCQFHSNSNYGNGSYADAQKGHGGEVNPLQGSSHNHGFPNQGGGGGAQSYWARWPQNGWQGGAGHGGSGYFVIRWAV